MTTSITWYKSPLLFFQILTHLSIIPMIMYASTFDWIMAIVMYYLIGCWGIAITYHRLISHRSFKSPAWFTIIGLILGTLGGVGSTIQWICQHREHHAYADTDKDPHSPAGGIKTFIKMHFMPMLIQSSPRYVIDLLRDPLHKKFHEYYWHINFVYVAILLCVDPFAIVYAYLFPAFLLWHAIASLGTFAHTNGFGYRSTSTKDNSHNLWFLGYMAFGEGWHNNHHAKASDWQFGKKWWEFDLSACIIRLVKQNH
jgi:fatty-acid desaturase